MPARLMPAAPRFWDEPPGLLAALLSPAAMLWQAGGRLRGALARPYRPPVPVVCVGNLVAGGAGKTPVVLALTEHLTSRGVAAHILTRGYRGRLRGPVRVDPARDDAAAVGDEALLLAAAAPCWVARDRPAGARAAVAAGAGALVLDDGLQNPTLAKALSLVVVDAEYGFGNGRIIPAGPLRESLDSGLGHADAVVLLGPEGSGVAVMRRIAGRVPVLDAELRPVGGERFAGARLLGFAGIGRPRKFFAALAGLGADLVAVRPFPDHHRFRPGELAALRRAAEREAARLVTTVKDFVRLPPELRHGIEVLEVAIRWREPERLAGLLAPIAGAAGRDDRGIAV